MIGVAGYIRNNIQPTSVDLKEEIQANGNLRLSDI